MQTTEMTTKRDNLSMKPIIIFMYDMHLIILFNERAG